MKGYVKVRSKKGYRLLREKERSEASTFLRFYIFKRNSDGFVTVGLLKSRAINEEPTYHGGQKVDILKDHAGAVFGSTANLPREPFLIPCDREEAEERMQHHMEYIFESLVG